MMTDAEIMREKQKKAEEKKQKEEEDLIKSTKKFEQINLDD